jgi:hypothetical protein
MGVPLPSDIALYKLFSTNLITEYSKHASHSSFFSSESSEPQTTECTDSGICHTLMNRLKFTDKIYINL